MSAESPRPENFAVSHAEKFIKDEGIQLSSEITLSEGELSRLAKETYELLVERRYLRRGLSWGKKIEDVQSTGVEDLEERLTLIREGKVEDLLTLPKEPPKADERLEKVKERLSTILATPGVVGQYERSRHWEMQTTKPAAEVAVLDGLIDQIGLDVIKLARQVQVAQRSLSPAENERVQNNRKIKEAALERRTELLRDPEVFDRVRLLELQRYRGQLQTDRFAETPSRTRYLDKIEHMWAEGKKVLLTGHTGTGKTETIEHASRRLFGVDPESVTGNQDMNIYQLLGKTGFRLQEGDVFKPAPLIRAMVGRDGRGEPFLFDEIDRAPNQVIMGIKTILNARPGEKGIRVQTDSEGSFDIGPDYAVSATANIRSEKYQTATELDPAIARLFESVDIDYMPAPEVYDVALASLIDERGGVSLSEPEATILLKNLCDAASWIQDAYQGRKVVTDPKTGNFLEEKGQASTGKAASLRKAILDPGRTLDMLSGWKAAQIQGLKFEDYLNERIVEFVNNRAYPEEDRHYLAEIFALKGFLRGKKVGELMVAGLDQATFGSWTGRAKKKTAKETGSDYLTPEKVARLDPYKRFKRPAAAEAEELLAEEAGAETEKKLEFVAELEQKLSEFFGSSIEVSSPSQELLEVLTRAKEQGIESLKPYYLPNIKMKKEDNYPGWGKKPNNWYWENISNGKLDAAASNLPGEWVLIDTLQKPQYNNGYQLHEDDFLGSLLTRLRDEGKIPTFGDFPKSSRFHISWDNLHNVVLPEIANMLGVDPAQIKLPKEIEFNFLGNLAHPEWGTTSTLEWFEDSFGDDHRLGGGYSASGGLSDVSDDLQDEEFDDMGFRPQIVFPS